MLAHADADFDMVSGRAMPAAPAHRLVHLYVQQLGQRHALKALEVASIRQLGQVLVCRLPVEPCSTTRVEAWDASAHGSTIKSPKQTPSHQDSAGDGAEAGVACDSSN
jgi:hypothetical protein